MRNILVSVIINNYNYGRFLRTAIDSVLKQTYKNIELIVVDDGSTDDSREIIESYQTKIIPIIKDNGGQGSAFNVGWKNAKGRLILFLDADDYLIENTISILVDRYIHQNKEISKIQYRLKILLNGELCEKYFPFNEFKGTTDLYKKEVLEQLNYQFPPTSGNVFTREYLNKIMPIPEDEFKLCADNYLNIPAPFLGEILSINSFLGIYRIHGKNNWASYGLKDMSVKKLKLTYDLSLLKVNLVNRFSKGNNINVIMFSSIWRCKLILTKLGVIKEEKLLFVFLKGICSLLYDKKKNYTKKILGAVWFVIVYFSPLKSPMILDFILRNWSCPQK